MPECQKRLIFIFQDTTTILGSLTELRIRKQIYFFVRFFRTSPSCRLRALSTVSSASSSTVFAQLAWLPKAWAKIFYLQNSHRQPYLPRELQHSFFFITAGNSISLKFKKKNLSHLLRFKKFSVLR